MPVQPSSRVNALLTNFAVLAQQKAELFGYYKMFSLFPVDHRSDSYWEYNLGQMFADGADVIAPGEEAPTAHLDGEEKSYLCVKRGLKKAITEEDYDNAGGNTLAPQRAAAILVNQQNMIKLERLFAANFLQTGIWGSDQTGVASGASTNQFIKWNAASGATILQNVEQWKEKVETACANMPNKIGLSPDVYAFLRYSSEIKDQVKYTSSESVSLQTLARLFDVEEVVVMGGIYNSAKEGATPTLARISTGKVLLTYAPKVGSLEEVTAGVCFGWNSKGRGLSKYGTRIKQWTDEKRDCDWVQGESYVDLKKICAQCGLLANTVLA